MIASFARDRRSDCAAVAAALREPWSNGQTVGQINRLKPSNARLMAAPTSISSGNSSSPRRKPENAPALIQSQN